MSSCADTVKEIFKANVHHEMTSLAYYPDRHLLASCGDGDVILIDASTWEVCVAHGPGTYTYIHMRTHTHGPTGGSVVLSRYGTDGLLNCSLGVALGLVLCPVDVLLLLHNLPLTCCCCCAVVLHNLPGRRQWRGPRA